jgi:hypothetical protein
MIIIELRNHSRWEIESLVASEQKKASGSGYEDQDPTIWSF